MEPSKNTWEAEIGSIFSPHPERTIGYLTIENQPPERINPQKWRGWFAVGGEKEQPFTGENTLPPRITWWSNLQKEETWGIGKWRQYKGSDLLGRTGAEILELYGMGEAKAEEQTQQWSELFTRLSWNLNRAEEQDQRKWEWSEGSLIENMAINWGAWKKVAQDPMELNFQTGYQVEGKIRRPFREINKLGKLTLNFNQTEHAERILEHRVPVGDWVALDKISENMRDNPGQWLQSETRPLLLELEFIRWKEAFDHEAQGRLLLGGRGEFFNSYPVEPVMVTGEEALVLYSQGHWKLLRGWRGDGWGKIEGLPNWWGDGFIQSNPLAPWSMTGGLLSEMTWKALSSPIRKNFSRKKSRVTAQSIWLRKADRMRCWEAAKTLQDKGFLVTSYGEGMVRVAFDSQATPGELWEAIKQTDLLPPMELARAITFTAGDDDPAGVQMTRVMETIWRQSQRNRIQPEIERLAFPWLGKGTQEILKQAVGQLKEVDFHGLNNLKNHWQKELLPRQARVAVDRLKKPSRSV